MKLLYQNNRFPHSFSGAKQKTRLWLFVWFLIISNMLLAGKYLWLVTKMNTSPQDHVKPQLSVIIENLEDDHSTESMKNKEVPSNRWNVTNITNQFYLITELTLFHGRQLAGYENFTLIELTRRDLEYISTLQSNLNHPLVKEIHLLYTDNETMTAIKETKLDNRQKIVPVLVGKQIKMKDFFSYASSYLLDKPVIGLNSDIELGEGFENLDTLKMRDNKVLYSLTRHGNSHGDCTVDNFCLHKKYQGSHDAHVLRLKESLEEKILQRLDYPINISQAENGMIGVFQHFFKYRVYNPCSILRIYHNHCSYNDQRLKHASLKRPPYSWNPKLLGKAYIMNEIYYE